MSDKRIPVKGEYILNTKTNRMCKIGGRAWLKCVKEGLLEGNYRDPDKLDTIDEHDDVEHVEQKIKKVQKKLPRGVQAVRGRGKHKGKIVKRSKPVSARESQRYTIRSAQKVVSENLDELIDADDIEAELEQLINLELAKGSSNNNDEIYDDDETEYEYSE